MHRSNQPHQHRTIQMVYFPPAVFKNIMSYVPRAVHPTVHMLPFMWPPGLQLNDDEKKGFLILKQMICSMLAKRRYTRPIHAAMKPHKLVFKHHTCFSGDCGKFYLDKNGTAHQCYNNKFKIFSHRDTTAIKGTEVDMNVKDIKKYLKQNGFKRYSKLKRHELIKLCMSF